VAIGYSAAAVSMCSSDELRTAQPDGALLQDPPLATWRYPFIYRHHSNCRGETYTHGGRRARLGHEKKRLSA
jgi:hypothetical protein